MLILMSYLRTFWHFMAQKCLHQKIVNPTIAKNFAICILNIYIYIFFFLFQNVNVGIKSLAKKNDDQKEIIKKD